jgi:hypothetical protein
MPIELTTPFNPGDADEGKSYTHVKIVKFSADLSNNLLTATVRYGYFNEEVWVDGVHIRGATLLGFTIEGADFVDIVSKMTSAAGVLIYDEVARELNQHLLDKGYFQGTVV